MKKWKALMPEAYFESIQQTAICGTHDVFSCIRGHFITLEFKASESAIRSALQDWKAKCIHKAGGRSFFVYPENAAEVESHLLKIYHASSKIV